MVFKIEVMPWSVSTRFQGSIDIMSNTPMSPEAIVARAVKIVEKIRNRSPDDIYDVAFHMCSLSHEFVQMPIDFADVRSVEKGVYGFIDTLIERSDKR